jgi:hypothetical protein
MRKIPTSINAQFNALLNKSKIPKRYQNHYLKWLRYYLDFCHKYVGRMGMSIGKSVS